MFKGVQVSSLAETGELLYAPPSSQITDSNSPCSEWAHRTGEKSFHQIHRTIMTWSKIEHYADGFLYWSTVNLSASTLTGTFKHFLMNTISQSSTNSLILLYLVVPLFRRCVHIHLVTQCILNNILTRDFNSLNMTKCLLISSYHMTSPSSSVFGREVNIFGQVKIIQFVFLEVIKLRKL